MATEEIFPGVTIDPEVQGGQPLLAGTRFPTVTVLRYSRNFNGDMSCFRDAFPDVTEGQIRTALAFESTYLGSRMRLLVAIENHVSGIRRAIEAIDEAAAEAGGDEG